jgi:hypothetical protein
MRAFAPNVGRANGQTWEECRSAKSDKTQDDAGGDPGILCGGWTAFPGWRSYSRSSRNIEKSYQGSRYDSTTWRHTMGKYILHVGEL